MSKVGISREDMEELEKMGVMLPYGLCPLPRPPRKGNGRKKHERIRNGGKSN
ncbi:MAG: hypothetical protein CEN89_360 [Candidatus Berkelbacteria bacterium Licking1014_7]|uniref:Uncharacterized protein n=1 Tax=Candidatus Berkelbacteria bacterium Licking1014_7 TaxID=2017147 RepID=A0A554LJD7_9BACT|nr:MAG: hypothetical protein CEN89_360 [Candidatus Berkelbacteria bacterium Licking1014_7]